MQDSDFFGARSRSNGGIAGFLASGPRRSCSKPDSKSEREAQAAVFTLRVITTVIPYVKSDFTGVSSAKADRRVER
jgi:hypothetical protein